jgi:YHS domain-containing protein
MTTFRSTPEASTIKTACGGILHDPSRYPNALFKGELVYFCNNACLDAFQQAPEAFMAGEIEHPVEDVENQNSMKRKT